MKALPALPIRLTTAADISRSPMVGEGRAGVMGARDRRIVRQSTANEDIFTRTEQSEALSCANDSD